MLPKSALPSKIHGTPDAKPSLVNIRAFLTLCTLFAIAAAKTQALAEVSMIISVADQKMAVFKNDALVAEYPVSTSKYGVGDRTQSYATPMGIFTVVSRIGAGAPEGAVFKGRRMTGEVVRPNAPGRDAIVTRILQLRGLTSGAAHALDRGIYIHGTPAESQLGRPASYGCIRMRSRDIVRVFDDAPVGTKIAIIKTPIARVLARAASVQRPAEGRGIAAN
jgi:lipoprotein-anchoring transpeptidase ErfK/SrfK